MDADRDGRFTARAGGQWQLLVGVAVGLGIAGMIMLAAVAAAVVVWLQPVNVPLPRSKAVFNANIPAPRTAGVGSEPLPAAAPEPHVAPAAAPAVAARVLAEAIQAEPVTDAAPALEPAEPVDEEPVAEPPGKTPPLKYSFSPEQKLYCHFSLDATLAGVKQTLSGLTVYTPSTADPATFSGQVFTEENEGTGSAFAIRPDGTLVTCAHVVQGATEIIARFGEQSYKARVLVMDAQRDLAVLTTARRGGAYLSLGESRLVELGQDVRAVGYPLTDVLGETIKISRGTISGIVDRDDGRMFQIDAVVNPGNSGGPLVDDRGRVVGVASALLTGESIDSVGFAVPADEVIALLREQHVTLPAAGEARTLAGPELARQVTPAVALLKVKCGPGGAGMEEQRVVGFSSHANSAGSGFGGGRDDQGQMLVDCWGNVAGHEGRTCLPFVLEDIATIGIEQLPGDSRTRWKSMRAVTLVSTESDEDADSWRGGFGPPSLPGRRGYPFGPPSRFRGPRGPFGSPWDREPERQRVTTVPAIERISYSIGGAAPLTINKEYELAVTGNADEAAPIHVAWKGTIKWDQKAGRPTSAAFTGTTTVRQENTTVRVPVEFSYRFEEKAVDAPRSTTGRATPRPALPTAAPPKTQIAPERDAEKASSARGLDQFRPEL